MVIGVPEKIYEVEPLVEPIPAPLREEPLEPTAVPEPEEEPTKVWQPLNL